MAERSRSQFVGNLDERVPMTMPKAGRATVLAAAETVVEDGDRPFWQALLNPRREDRLADARQGVDNDRPVPPRVESRE